jgi:hypothetical protein
MKNPIRWIALALFPNSKIANRPVKVSREEWLALKRENTESSQSAMGETVPSGLLGKYIPWKPLGTSSRYKKTGKGLEVNNLEDPSEF